jgi:hypothetical protein
MKQTAVQWLVEQLTSIGQLEIPKGSNVVTEIIKQAKAMEREQMCSFADEYGTYLLQGGTMSAVTYNETFNKSIKNKG